MGKGPPDIYRRKVLDDIQREEDATRKAEALGEVSLKFHEVWKFVNTSESVIRRSSLVLLKVRIVSLHFSLIFIATIMGN